MVTNEDAADVLSGTPGAPFLGTPGTMRAGLPDPSVWCWMVLPGRVLAGS